jgi:hypothetical protein
MSDSVFAENANALLIFKIGSGLFQEDPATGNPIQMFIPLEIQCMLKRPKTSSQPEQLIGNDQMKTILEGRAIEPMHLPQEITTGARAQCTLFDVFSGNKEHGEFIVETVIQSPFAVVTEILGSYIKGEFKRLNAGELLYG